jgi:hypothetical protein
MAVGNYTCIVVVTVLNSGVVTVLIRPSSIILIVRNQTNLNLIILSIYRVMEHD